MTTQATPLSTKSISSAREELMQDSSCVGMDFCQSYTAAVDSYLEELFWDVIKRKGSRLEVEGKDIALIALGGYGRGEMSPQSDLDIQLIYGNDYRSDVDAIANELWYPLWNDNLKLGHSIGSYNDILLLARHELNTATTLLSARHIAGDAKLTERLRNKAHNIWYSKAGHWLGELLEDAERRHEQFGSVAYMLEPNLKQGAGGLRDTQLMCWGLSAMLRRPPFGKDPSAKPSSKDEASTEPLDYSVGSGIFADDDEIRDAYRVLLTARIELHRLASKAEDRLLFAFQDEIAQETGYGDALALMSDISLSARLISWRLTELAVHFRAMGKKFDGLVSKLRRRTGVSRKLPTYDLDWQPIGGEVGTIRGEAGKSGEAASDGQTSDGVASGEQKPGGAKSLSFADDDWTCQNIEIAKISSEASDKGEDIEDAEVEGHSLVVRISPDAKIDNLSILRLAVVAAEYNALIDRDTLNRLKQQAPAMPEPWPSHARELFLQLLMTGRPAVQVIEALDIAELFTKLLPEWEPCRCRPQQNVYHRFTVDRHLCEAAAEAVKLIERVDRPDLLVLGAFLHDIGKGYPGDHTVVGIPMVGQIAKRMGFPSDDVAILQLLVREHLLLPDTATRRDLSDVSIIKNVAEKVETVEALNLLSALTEADSIATSKHAWSPWKKGLLNDLQRRTEQYLIEGTTEEVEESVPTKQHKALMAAGESMVHSSGGMITIISPNYVGQFSEVVGVLTLNGLYIREGLGHVEHNMALCHFLVEPTFEGEINWGRIEPQIRAALDGRLALEARLARRAVPKMATTGEPMIEKSYVKFDNDSSQTHTVIEVGVPDCFGLLRNLAVAMTQMRIEISSLKAQTLGGSVVDSFYVQNSIGDKVTDPEQQSEVEAAIQHAVKLSLPS